ncbi:MAG: DNA (cytosine-5-)-methyltransferase, partial [bacterium]
PLKGGSKIGIPSPPAIWMPDGKIVTPDIRDAERMQGLPAGWTKAAEDVARNSLRWRLVGNAVTVKIAQWIGHRLRKPADYDGSEDDRVPNSSSLPRAAWSNGRGMKRSEVSTWPIVRPPKHLHEFLRYDPTFLSAAATAGFASRARVSGLRFPRGFLGALDRHRELMLRKQR